MFREKYVQPESQASAKHNWYKLTFDPIAKSLSDFLKELNEGPERAFGDNDQTYDRQFTLRRTAFPLNRSINLAYLKNSTNDQIVAYLGKELKLRGLENDEELKIPTMTTVSPNDSQ